MSIRERERVIEYAFIKFSKSKSKKTNNSLSLYLYIDRILLYIRYQQAH
jgi:hypothetical protein